jgi:hypothetical protein
MSINTMVLSSEEKGRRIAAGIQAKKDNDPVSWDETNDDRSRSQAHRINKRKLEDPDGWITEKDIRQEGTNRLHADAKRHKRWKCRVTFANGALKPKNKVKSITIPTLQGSVLDYIRGYEDRTIDLLTSMFGEQQLVSWQFKNDCYFEENKTVRFSAEFLNTLQVQCREVTRNDKDDTSCYTCDHTLSVPKADQTLFCHKLGELFQVKEQLQSYFSQGDSLVMIESKSFSGARVRGVNWWGEIVTKSNVVVDTLSVYFLLEHNRYGVTLFVRTKAGLVAIGASLYRKKNVLSNFRNYYKSLFNKEVTVPNFVSYGTLPRRAPLTTAVSVVDSVVKPYVTLMKQKNYD